MGPDSVRNVDGLNLIIIDFYVPALIQRLNSTETSLQLSETLTQERGGYRVVYCVHLVPQMYHVKNHTFRYNSRRQSGNGGYSRRI
jgi:hypothetical protein